MIEGSGAEAAIPGSPAYPPVPYVPALNDLNGEPIAGTERPALPGVPARLARPARLAEGLIKCSFNPQGKVTIPSKEEELLSLFEMEDIEFNDEELEDTFDELDSLL
jgi:hypothetical protein